MLAEFDVFNALDQGHWNSKAIAASALGTDGLGTRVQLLQFASQTRDQHFKLGFALVVHRLAQDLQQLGNTMSYVAPVAASYGISLQMVAAATEVLLPRRIEIASERFRAPMRA